MRSTTSSSEPTALIVEDEPALCEELREMLQALWPALKIRKHAGGGVEALRQIAQHQPHVVFLDIRIPKPNGLDIARAIRDRCHIVFVAAHDAHAIEAFENGAVDYILKPINPDRLALTVHRLQQRLAQPPADLSRLIAQLQPQQKKKPFMRWITASVGASIRLIMIDEVVFFQSDQKYTRVVLAESEVLIKKTLKELVAELDPEQFWQTHRSTVVNALEISSIEPKSGQMTVRLKNRREQLPVSESFVRRLRQM